MAKRMKVAVAMSGGVDSSMTAALLKEAGYEVYGVHMLLSPDHNPEHNISDLEGTCELLDIPLYKLNFESEYQREVIDYFCKEYALGRTPNPCIACNRHIKFHLLLDRALKMGAHYLATGHYARVKGSLDGFSLLKGIDTSKDQSYFLYTLGQRQLQYLLLPLGNRRKTEIRNLAGKLGLPTAKSPESQDVCFIRDKDYRPFITQRIPLKPGDIVDSEGRVLGKHQGLALYTVGQRQGLRLATKERYYVIKLDAATNRVVVGSEDKLLSSSLTAGKLNWIAGKALKKISGITAKIRYRSPEVRVKLYTCDSGVEVKFDEPQRAITPGQAIVFYKGDVVLGGGVIEG